MTRRPVVAAIGSLTALAVLLAFCRGPAPEPEPTTADEGGNMSSAARLDGLVTCEAPDHAAFAGGALVNVSEATWVFDVTVEWYDIDGNYYTGATARTHELRPGASSRWVIDPGSPFMPGGRCEVVEITKIEPGGSSHSPPVYPTAPDGS